MDAGQDIAGGNRFTSPHGAHLLGDSGYSEAPVFKFEEEGLVVFRGGYAALAGSDLILFFCASPYRPPGSILVKKEENLTHVGSRKETCTIMAYQSCSLPHRHRFHLLGGIFL